MLSTNQMSNEYLSATVSEENGEVTIEMKRLLEENHSLHESIKVGNAFVKYAFALCFLYLCLFSYALSALFLYPIYIFSALLSSSVSLPSLPCYPLSLFCLMPSFHSYSPLSVQNLFLYLSLTLVSAKQSPRSQNYLLTTKALTESKIRPALLVRNLFISSPHPQHF